MILEFSIVKLVLLPVTIMKSFKALKKLMRSGDKEFIAEQLQISGSLVRMVVNGNRSDHYGILESFNVLIELREEYYSKVAARIAKIKKNL